MLASPLMFGALVAVGIAYRRRPEVHRPMMLLATQSLMTGSLDRSSYMARLTALVHGNVPVFHWRQILLLGALLFVLHAAMTRRTSRYYAAGYASLAVGSLLSVVVAHSTTWNQIAALVAR